MNKKYRNYVNSRNYNALSAVGKAIAREENSGIDNYIQSKQEARSLYLGEKVIADIAKQITEEIEDIWKPLK